MRKEDKYCEYLLRNVKETFESKEFFSCKNKTHTRYNPKFVQPTNECFKYTIENIFGLKNIDCKLYDSVINGQGNEKDKINSLYSSSLQSLVAFHNVNNDNQIKIQINNEHLSFDKVYFEQKNKVIGYPSSIDVVLTNKDSVLFIESKLFEIVRDSTDSDDTPKVIGVSYLSNRDSSYHETLKIKEVGDLNKIGIYPNRYPIEDKKLNKEDATSIKRFEDNKFVYSEGIKQVLSHLIGISNFEKGNYHEGCIEELKKRKFKKYYYIELYNELPGFDFEEANEKLKQFKKHVEGVFEITKNKINVICDIKTYQELYKENSNMFNDTIVKYYHLDEKR